MPGADLPRHTGTGVPALPLIAALPAAAFTAFAALSLLWTSDLEAGTTTLAFFLLPFTALVAVVARAPFPPWLPRVLAIIAVALATLFAVIGIWQAATHELLFFAPNLEVANTYSPIFRVTSLFRDPSLYGRHVVLGIVVLVVAVWLRRIPTLPAVALIALLWTGLYFSYSQSSLAALFVAVLAIGAIAGNRGVRMAVAATTAVLLLVGTGARRERGARHLGAKSDERPVAARRAHRACLRRASDCGCRHRVTAACEPAAVRALRAEAQLRLARHAGDRRRRAGRDRSPRLRRTLLVATAFLVEAVRRRDMALGLTLEATLLALFVHSLFYSGFFEDPITWFAFALAAGYLVSHDEPAEEVATIAPSPEPALT